MATSRMKQSCTTLSGFDLTGSKPDTAENRTDTAENRNGTDIAENKNRIEVIGSRRAPTANDRPICDGDPTRIRATTEMGHDVIRDATWRTQWRDIVSNNRCLRRQLSNERF